MSIRPIIQEDRIAFNNIITHPLQSYEWGEFREKTGVKVIRRGIFENNKLIDGFQLTIHPIPHTPWTIGYVPKGNMPTEVMIKELLKIGKEERCILIQLEPNIIQNPEFKVQNIFHNSEFKILDSVRPLFTKYTFILDLTQSEEELLKHMHPKTRYNIKVAQKNGVQVAEDNTKEAFETYWQLMEETTKRQKFYAHSKMYHELQWQIFPHKRTTNTLSSHLLVGSYQGKILTTMLFFIFHDMLYYPYGASSNQHRNLMHSTLTMWEGIKFGKKLGLKQLDMWGALESNPNPKNDRFGFHDFKRKFGPQHVQFVGSYDLVVQPGLYQGYKIADRLRWLYLKLRK